MCSGARHAARLAFKRKYSLQKFNLYINDSEIETWAYIWLSNANRYWHFYEKRLKCLRLLRNFGDLMFRLKIDTCQLSNNADKRLRKGIQYVRKFGAECHKKLVIRNYLPILLRYPFRNVDKIEVHSAAYSIAEFNGLTEKVSNLAIRCSDARKYFNQPMPQIKWLKIKCWKYNGFNMMKIEDTQRAMLLNPQIEELLISSSPGEMFKMKLNGSKIEVVAEGNFFSGLAIRPNQYDSMFLVYSNYRTYFAIVSFVKKFKNLKCLTMRWGHGLLIEAIEAMSMLETLQIFVKDELELLNKILFLDQILLSAGTHNNLSVLSFNFKRNDLREMFLRMADYNWLMDQEFWFVTLHENGPKEYKFSLDLNRIEADKN